MRFRLGLGLGVSALSLVATASAWSASRRATRLMSSAADSTGVAGLLKTLLVRDVDSEHRPVRYLDTGGGSGDPPVVMLIGTGQSIEGYGMHVRPFVRAGRRLIVAEMRAQGTATSLLPSHCTMQQLTNDLDAFLAGLGCAHVDLVGFSFGGRLALSYAATKPQQVRRLSLTGVPYERSGAGQLIIDSWKSLLSTDSSTGLRECAYSFLINGYSEAFINRHYDKLPSFIEMITEQNDASRLRSLIGLSHIADPADPLSAPCCARALSGGDVRVQLVGSSLDRIAAVGEVRRLAGAIAGAEFAEIAGAGHLCLFEKPAEWRSAVIEFLNK